MYSNTADSQSIQSSPVKISTRRAYLLPSIPNAMWIMDVATLLKHHTQLDIVGSGRYHTFEGLEFAVSNGLDGFVRSLQRDWDDVQALSFTVSNIALFIEVGCQFQSAETSIWIEANTQTEIFQFLDVLENALDLEKFTNELIGGRECRYSIRQSPDADWFDQAFSIFVSPSPEDYFAGTIVEKSKDKKGSEITHHFRNFDEFVNQIRVHQTTAYRISCWVSQKRSHIDFEVDLLRWHMRLRIEGWKNETQTTFQNAEEKLCLQQQIEDPYRYRKFAQTYKITQWRNNTEVATALKRIIDRFFVNKYGREPAVVEAFATTGDMIEDMHPYAGEFSKFIAWIAAEQNEIKRITLYVQGPLHQAVGIFIYRDVEELRVASSLGIAQSPEGEPSFALTDFQEVVKIIRNAIVTDPKPTKDSTDDQPGKNLSQWDKFWIWWEKFWMPAIGGLVGFPAALLAAQPILFPALGWTYELRLNSETRYSKPVPGNQLKIDWTLKRPRLKDNPDAENQAARVQVKNQQGTVVYPELSNGADSAEKAQVESLSKIDPVLPPVIANDLPAGNYYVSIETIAPVVSKPDVFVQLLGDKPAPETTNQEDEGQAPETATDESKNAETTP